MEIDIQRGSNRLMVYCMGDLDAAGARALERTVGLLVDEGDLPIALDLSNVTSIAHAGVQILALLFELAGRRESEDRTGPPRLRLLNAPEPIQRVLDVSGLFADLERWDAMTLDPHPGAGRTYQDLLPRVRDLFPSPVSDPMRDAYFVQSVARSMDRVDQLKTQRPYLGERVSLDYDAAQAARLPDHLSTLERTLPMLADYLQGLIIWGHPHTQENVVPPTTIAAIVGQMLGAVYNPNTIWDAYSHRVAEAEVEASAICAALVGYDPARAAGVSTFGGTGTILYGVKLGVEKAQPNAFRDGVRGSMKVVCSEASHYAKINVLGWLGLGTSNLVSVPTDLDNSMSLAGLETTLRGLFERGERVACIIATMGTTDSFALDNLAYIVRLRDALAQEYGLSYRPHVHADAVIGWPWAVFNDYDFEANHMGFPMRTLRSLWDVRTNLRALQFADSIGIDFHKTGYGPYVSSMLLVRDRADLELIARDRALMPYLFQFGDYRPGVYTLEASRSGGAILAALANLKLLGEEGYRVILGHIVTMAETLRARLDKIPYAQVVNDYNYGPVTLFRVYPDGIEAAPAFGEETMYAEKADQLAAHNTYNRRVFDALQRQMEQGEGVALSLTDECRRTSYGAPLLALKSFVMSPFVDEAAMDVLLVCLDRARAEVSAAG